MAEKRHKLSISFPKERKHVWELLEEHCEETKETNRSAVIISLLEKALTSSTPDGDNSSGLYELERLSKQIEECHQRIEELGELIMAQYEGHEVNEEDCQCPTNDLEDDLPDEYENEYEDEADYGQHDGDSHMVTDDDESAVGQDEEPNVDEDVSKDNIAPEPQSDLHLASTTIIAWINDNPSSTPKT